MQSLDVTGSNIKKIRELFPHCVTERRGGNGELELAVDFEKLKLELSDDIIRKVKRGISSPGRTSGRPSGRRMSGLRRL